MGSSLLNSTKQCLVNLASGAGVLVSVQHAAQQVLLCGWNYLLPTVSERASALLDLLPNEDGPCAVPHSLLPSPSLSLP